MHRLLPILIGIGIALPAPAFAGSVIVFPLDARGVSYDTAASATQWILETIRAVPGSRVIEPATVEKEIGVKLTEQARACDYDVFCLVEVGELLQGDTMLIGHVRLVNAKEGDQQELKLIQLDVAKATIVEVLIWKVPNWREGGLEDAVRVAAKRLFAKPDAQVVLQLDPKNARLYLYGDPVQLPEDAAPLAYWSGTYLATVEAEGYHPKQLKLVIPQTDKRSSTRIPIELEQDLLYVPKGGKKQVQPFDRASRREGSGVASDVAGAVTDDDGPRTILVTPWPYLTAAAAIGLGVGGSFLMANAQSDYNSLSGQERYQPGITVTSAVAIGRRDDAKSGYRTGSALLMAGGGVMVGTLIWVIIDWVLTP